MTEIGLLLRVGVMMRCVWVQALTCIVLTHCCEEGIVMAGFWERGNLVQKIFLPKITELMGGRVRAPTQDSCLLHTWHRLY